MLFVAVGVLVVTGVVAAYGRAMTSLCPVPETWAVEALELFVGRDILHKSYVSA
jgi:hypothetical protein